MTARVAALSGPDAWRHRAFPPPFPATLDEAQAAADAWGFNCGPASICAVTGKTPAEIRPCLGDFERKRYTNPTLMWDILRGLGVCWHKRADRTWPEFGLVRVQWAGPWTRPGVPIRARYRHTHWVASHFPDFRDTAHMVFDVNAICVGGWLPFREWADDLVPWLLKQCEPKASGEWWATHSIEVRP